MWVLPKGFSPPILVGTTAIFFAVINLFKIPAYLALGQFTHENLTAAAVLALQGKHKVEQAAPPQPEQTVETLKEDVEWVKRQPESVRR